LTDPQHRGLEQGRLINQLQELLRVKLARQGPQSGSGAAGQDYGLDLNHSMLPFMKNYSSSGLIFQLSNKTGTFHASDESNNWTHFFLI
jgi:hypothetical protein